jgi:hypothetical protein
LSTESDQYPIAGDGTGAATLPRLRTIVREVLLLPESEDVDMRTLRELGTGSVQAVAVQFRILQETSVSVGMGELVADTRVADIATLIDARRPTAGPGSPG